MINNNYNWMHNSANNHADDNKNILLPSSFFIYFLFFVKTFFVLPKSDEKHLMQQLSWQNNTELDFRKVIKWKLYSCTVYVLRKTLVERLGKQIIE